MAVRLRLKRVGRKNRPAYRICAMDSRRARDSREIEVIGKYDPYIGDNNEKYDLDEDRVKYWLSVGAKPSETVGSFIKARGIDIPWEAPKKGPKKPRKRKKTEPSKQSLKRKAAKAKKARLADRKKHEAARKPAAPSAPEAGESGEAASEA